MPFPTWPLFMIDFSVVLKSWKKMFEPDCGTLLDIHALDATAKDWQCLLDYLSANHRVQYSEDGTVCPLPTFATIWERRHRVSVVFSVLVEECKINCFFFALNSIEMDLSPDEIDSKEKAKSVLELIVSLARILQKEIFLSGEGIPSTEAALRKMAVLSITPDGNFLVRREFINGQEPATSTS